MIAWRKAKVWRVIQNEPDLQELEVSVDGAPGLAWNLPLLTGRVEVGDEVYLNTTAVSIGLGSGGYDFVLANLTRIPDDSAPAQGHIMKLRYTPLQVSVLAVEEETSPHHPALAELSSLEGTPVIAGTLHSQLAPAVAGCLAADHGWRIAYVMSDGAALPLALSRIVRRLNDDGLLAGTVTVGHSFGGDLEAVNIYSGLVAARQVLKADLIIVTMGPGIVGTGTRWGTTALEQGEIINAINILGGVAIAIPRISFADPRQRHHGVSHHTLTALGMVALSSAAIACPVLPADQWQVVQEQLLRSGILDRHRLLVRDGWPALRLLEQRAIPVDSMGRGIDDDPACFLSAGAAGMIADEMLSGNQT